MNTIRKQWKEKPGWLVSDLADWAPVQNKKYMKNNSPRKDNESILNMILNI